MVGLKSNGIVPQNGRAEKVGREMIIQTACPSKKDKQAA